VRPPKYEVLREMDKLVGGYPSPHKELERKRPPTRKRKWGKAGEG